MKKHPQGVEEEVLLLGRQGRRGLCGRAGFTLIELMAVVGIIFLIMGFAIVGFRSVGGQRMDVGLREVRSQLIFARQWAITSREDTCLIIPATGSGTPNENLRAYRLVSGSGASMTNPLSAWMYLPQGIFFDRRTGPDFPDSILYANLPDLSVPDEIVPPDTVFRYFRFNARGEMVSTGSDQRIYLTEGVLGENETVTPFQPHLRDLILVRHLTGLSELHRLGGGP